ncbi:fibronectin type III domain-containing protein [Chryseobacterium aquaticum]|uniref:fibronectin type III domain-containing protein n=1 Tax=Chryseobacterium aquaticum TaxID=452084 RepID=UPI002FC940C9
MKHFYTISLPREIAKIRRIFSVFAIFLSVAFSQQFFAQLYPVAGTCTSLGTNTYALNSTANSSATNRIAVIYPASQLVGIAGQQLNSMFLKKFTATDLGGTPNLKIYLKETPNVDFGTGTIDWSTQITGATLLYDSNPVTAAAGAAGWKEFSFSSNFSYSGTSNLMLLMEYVNTGNTTSTTWQYEYTAPCVVTTNSYTTRYINTTTGTLGTSLTSNDYRRPVIGFNYVVTCPSTTVPVVSGITTNSATANWNAGGTETSWDYAVGLSNAGIPTTWTTTSTPTATLSLNPQTEYIFYVRANCGGSNGSSAWKASIPFKTLCAPTTSMFENFDSYATGNIVPDCWARIVGASNTAQSISSTTPASGARNILQTTSTAANATIVVLPEFSNVNAGTHWLRFKARVASATGSLDVGYVTNIADASTFVNIQTVNILNTSYTAQDSEYTVIVPNTVPSNARLAIRNNGASTVGHFYDDVYWEAKPSCISPTNISVSNISPTSAQIQWTASVTPPANGYDIYYSTSNTPPTASTTPSATGITGTSTTISQLSPSTLYYFWVRSRCSSSSFSNWTTQIVSFNTSCQSPAILSTVGATVCPNNPATLSATSEAGALFTWYDAATAGNIVGSASSYTTPPLSATTSYWVTAKSQTSGIVGKTTPVSTTGNNGFNDVGLVFDAINKFTLQSIDIYPIHATNTTGTVTIALKNSAGTTLETATVNVNISPSGLLNTVALNFNVPAGNGHRLVVTGVTNISNLIRESVTTAFTYPYILPGVCSITSAYTGGVSAIYYYYLYNWQVISSCESPRTMVTATVDTNCLSTSEIDKRDAIKVYPNPFSEIINITKPELVKTVRVSDISGKLLRTINRPEAVLRLNDLSAGMYLLQLDMKDGSQQSIKMIKK